MRLKAIPGSLGNTLAMLIILIEDTYLALLTSKRLGWDLTVVAWLQSLLCYSRLTCLRAHVLVTQHRWPLLYQPNFAEGYSISVCLFIAENDFLMT